MLFITNLIINVTPSYYGFTESICIYHDICRIYTIIFEIVSKALTNVHILSILSAEVCAAGNLLIQALFSVF